MRVRLIAAGTRLPGWVNEGYTEYAKRLVGIQLELVEIPPRRSMLKSISPRDYVVALEVTGRAMTTGELAHWLEARLAGGRDLAFVIGGPEGHAPELLERADFRWSLSPLTWPHGLARVMVAEQLYRAQSILKGHPYHRG
ncbi:MAG: 23S rRNA (pseudouridine(1915)-N(3))-methyltransferase RlmH [Gammaproteobacteria bacterium]|nr:23S rRNA (pseudouridine(1915)-N(3))-methyltransferase RlmH [Gammaproteobacteria bacterium]